MNDTTDLLKRMFERGADNAAAVEYVAGHKN
jgi:two-component system sensor histidine kinase RegB